jgi:hypothetical protein
MTKFHPNDPIVKKAIFRERLILQKRFCSLSICDGISLFNHLTFGWKVVEGKWLGPNLPNNIFYHMWNELPDGTIVDCSADQFKLDPMLIVPPFDVLKKPWFEPTKEITKDNSHSLIRDLHPHYLLLAMPMYGYNPLFGT